MEPIEEKVCNTCLKSLPLSGFATNRRNGRLQYHARCKKCNYVVRNESNKAKRPPKEPKPVITEKPCNTCGIVKPLDAYETSKRGDKIWHVNMCHMCRLEKQRERRNADPDKSLKWKESYPKYRETILANKRTAYQENIEAERQKDREWYRENRDKVYTKGRRYAEANRDKVNAAQREWHKKHPKAYYSRTSVTKATLKARECGLTEHFTLREWVELMEKYDFRCLRCNRQIHLSPDHVQPFSMGGTNTIDNIQPLCHKCNVAKNSMHMDYRIECEFPGMELSIPIYHTKPKLE